MSLSPITINGGSILQPSKLREYKEFQETDMQAADGALQRNRVKTSANPNGYKFVAELEWADVPTGDFATLNTFFTTGSGVYYNNPASKYGVLTFSGMPYPEEGEYKPGESLLTTYKVKLRQV